MIGNLAVPTALALVAQTRDKLLETLGPNGRLIIDVIPEVALIIGEQPPAPELPTTASPLPLIGLAGGLFIALGGLMAGLRRRR